MKRIEYDEARKLRIEQGESINFICKKIGVSKGSVSRWCSDIVLTDEQKAKLFLKNPIINGQMAGANVMKKNAIELRNKYQEQGRDMARQYGNDVEFVTGCALYWAEGYKSRTKLGMTNLDVDLLIQFKRWAIKYFKCVNDSFKLNVSAYLNNGTTIDEINGFWVEKLDIAKQSVRKVTAREKYYSGLNRTKNRSIYGICQLSYCDVEIVQMVFGAIQELFKIDRPEWKS